jgi:serine/threonine protein phosphatase PrpC
MRFLPGNAQHIGARQSQQDSFGFADPNDQAFLAHGGFLAIVCDGMGGMEHGDAASRTAVRAFLEAYRRKLPEESIPAALDRSVHEANFQVVSMARSMGMVEGIGTTLVAVAMHEASLYFISVGDSGIFHCSGGQFQMINRPHVFANLLDAAVARGTLSQEDALNHPERESLTSYIGSETLAEIDRNLEPYPLRPGDTILLASDGMFKVLNPDEIRMSLQGPGTGWPEMLVQQTLAKQREYQDNITVLSITLDGAQAYAAAPARTVRLDPNPAAMPLPPPPPAPLAPAVSWTPPEELRTGTHAARSHTAPWVVALVLILLAAAAGFMGWRWYTKYSHPPAYNAPVTNIPELTTPKETSPAQSTPTEPRTPPQ